MSIQQFFDSIHFRYIPNRFNIVPLSFSILIFTIFDTIFNSFRCRFMPLTLGAWNKCLTWEMLGHKYNFEGICINYLRPCWKFAPKIMRKYGFWISIFYSSIRCTSVRFDFSIFSIFSVHWHSLTWAVTWIDNIPRLSSRGAPLLQQEELEDWKINKWDEWEDYSKWEEPQDFGLA